MRHSEMPRRGGPFENPTPESAELLRLATQADFLCQHFMDLGHAPDIALALTLHTLDRFDYQGDL